MTQASSQGSWQVVAHCFIPASVGEVQASWHEAVLWGLQDPIQMGPQGVVHGLQLLGWSDVMQMGPRA